MAKTCKACGGILGRDCFNELECLQISISQDQHSNQLYSELMWEKEVVQKDLLEKLTIALNALERICEISKNYVQSDDEANEVEYSIGVCNEYRNLKVPPAVNNNWSDDLPF